MNSGSKISTQNNLSYSQHYRLGKKIKPLLFERQGDYCWYCEKAFSFGDLTIEHIIPRSEGGTTSLENCILACIHCNARRENFPPPDVWRAYIRLKDGLKTEILNSIKESYSGKDLKQKEDLFMIYPHVKSIPNLKESRKPYKHRTIEYKIDNGKSKITGGWISVFLLKDCIIVSKRLDLNGSALSENDMLLLSELPKRSCKILN